MAFSRHHRGFAGGGPSPRPLCALEARSTQLGLEPEDASMFLDEIRAVIDAHIAFRTVEMRALGRSATGSSNLACGDWVSDFLHRPEVFHRNALPETFRLMGSPALPFAAHAHRRAL